jgi:hypothetical protein
VYVVLEGGPFAVNRDEPVDSLADQPELVEELRRTNELLREVITTRDEEIRRRDTIIMNMTEAMKALNPPAPEDSSEARESPESPGPTGELGELREELDAERTRREMAESTLRKGMDEERRRREEAERERDDLRRELFASTEPREAPETVEEEPERVVDLRTGSEAREDPTTQHPQTQRPTEGLEHDTSTLRKWSGDVEGRRQPDSEAGGAQEGAQRPWWRRIVGR